MQPKFIEITVNITAQEKERLNWNDTRHEEDEAEFKITIPVEMNGVIDFKIIGEALINKAIAGYATRTLKESIENEA
jgi:hypothetical protein